MSTDNTQQVRPFADLVKELPDGSIPAIEVAKLARPVELKSPCWAVDFFTFDEEEEDELMILNPNLWGSGFGVVINKDYEVMVADQSYKVARNQIAIIDYLRATGFLPAGAGSRVGGGGEAASEEFQALLRRLLGIAGQREDGRGRTFYELVNQALDKLTRQAVPADVLQDWQQVAQELNGPYTCEWNGQRQTMKDCDGEEAMEATYALTYRELQQPRERTELDQICDALNRYPVLLAALRASSPVQETPAARPFRDFAKQLPDGTIPAIEVARLALRLTANDNPPVLVEIPRSPDERQDEAPIVLEYKDEDGFVQQVLINSADQVDCFIEGDMMSTCNQPAIVDYLRATGFLPAAPAAQNRKEEGGQRNG